MVQSDLLLDEDKTTVINRIEITTGLNAASDIILWPKWATIDLGGGDGSNSDGDIKLKDQDGKPRVHFDAGGGGPKDSGSNRIYLDGSTSRAVFSAQDGTDRVSLDGQTGQIGVRTADGRDTLRVDGESGTIGFASRSYQVESRYSTPMLSMFEGEQHFLQREPVVPVVAYSSHLPRHGLVYDDERDVFLFQGDPPEPSRPDVVDEVTETELPEIDTDEPVEPVQNQPQGGFDFQTVSPTTSTSLSTDGGSNSGDGNTTGTGSDDGSGGSGSSDDSGSGGSGNRSDTDEPSDPTPVLSVDLQNERVGVGTDAPGKALDVEGSVSATAFAETSDARCKENVAPITDAIEAVTQLRGVSYEWTDEYAPEDDEDRHLGFLADEIESVLPSVVGRSEDGLQTIAPTDLIAVLVEAIKDQQAEIEARERRLEDQTDRLDRQRRRLNALEARVSEMEEGR